MDLTFKGLIGSEQKLLAGLAASVEGTRYLGAPERAICEGSAVFAGKWYALRDALIDDFAAYLR
jgi:hypothetical protein